MAAQSKCDHPDDRLAIVWPIVSCQGCDQEWLARDELRTVITEARAYFHPLDQNAQEAIDWIEQAFAAR